jgi:predicted nucleic acid-binding Zn ribbon protein
MKKLLSAPAVQFKGSGWYVNDYAKPASATDKTDKGSSEKPAASASEKSGTEGKSEKAAVDKPADKPAERKAESSRGEAAPAPSAPKAE